MYEFIKIRYDIIKQSHGNYKEMIKFNYNLEIDIFRNSIQKVLGVLRGCFKGFGCPKRHPDTLLAKTMDVSLVDNYITSYFSRGVYCGLTSKQATYWLKWTSPGKPLHG